MKKNKILVLAPLLFAMVGCSEESAPPADAVSGLFIDAEVEGLSFTTRSGISGQTDQNGTYQYRPGEDITFSVGGVELGTIPGAAECSPFDFGVASTNIARFIQSLDADNDPGNGIDIVAANTALAGTNIGSDAFIVDDATFVANPAIQGALTTTGDTLLDKATAVANLNAGTNTTFRSNELVGNVFVAVDPINNDLGVMFFDPAGQVGSMFASNSIAAGGNGHDLLRDWVLDAAGVMTITNTISGSVVKVNRIGSSSNSISATFSDNGAADQPLTLLIHKGLNTALLAGDGVNVTSKTYDIVDASGVAFSMTFTPGATATDPGSYVDNNSSDFGTIRNIVPRPGVVLVGTPAPGAEVTLVIAISGGLNQVGSSTSILMLEAIVVGISNGSPIFEFQNIGVGSATLTSTTP